MCYVIVSGFFGYDYMKYLIRIFLILLVTIPAFSLGETMHNENFYQWLLTEHEKDTDLNTNQIIRADEFNSFLETNITHQPPIYLGMTKKNKKETFTSHLRKVLGGPPDKISVNQEGIIIISGCRFQSCPEKGFIWIDTKSKKQVFVIVSYFFEKEVYNRDGFLVTYSSDFKEIEKLPSLFQNSLKLWLKQEKLEDAKIKFLR